MLRAATPPGFISPRGPGDRGVLPRGNSSGAPGVHRGRERKRREREFRTTVVDEIPMARAPVIGSTL